MQVLLDARWIELPVGAPVEAGEWAAEAVAEALSLRGIVEEPRVVHLYVQTYAATLDSIRARALEHDDVTVAGAYALVGQDALLADTVVELAYLPNACDRFEDFVDSFVVPADQRLSAPELSELDTAFGTAVRLEQLRIVDEGEGREPSLQPSVVYLWPGRTAGRAIVMSAWFGSPVDAETTRPVVDQLAVSLLETPA